MKIKLATAALAVVCLTTCGPPAPTDPCKNRKAGDLVVTEILIDPDSTDTGNEWFEVFNTTSSAIDLKGLTLFMRESSGTTKTHSIRAGSIPSRGFFTFGDVRSGPNPSWINYAYADALSDLPNSTGTVGVRCGTVTIAEVTWTKPARATRSRMLTGASGGVPVDPDATAAADEARWCDTPAGTTFGGTTNSGTPGTVNPECQPEATTGTCIDPGTGGVRPIASPAEGDLVITEVLARPSTREATQEWFEVLARNAVDLNDLTISSATASDKLTSANCLRVGAGEYALIARSADTFVNGELPPPLVTTTLSIANTNERLTLSKGDAGIDMAAFTSSASGVAWQLDPLKLDTVSNDDPGNFCRATTKWNPDGGGDYGTPGAANTTCPDSDGGVDGGGSDCYDTGLASTRPIVRPVVGDVVVTEVMADPSVAGDTQGEWFEVYARSDVDLNGVVLSNENSTAASQTTVASANCLRVTAGTYALFARTADPATNGGLPPVTATFTFDLTNSSSGAVQSHAVRLLSQGVELDRLGFPLTAGTCPSGTTGLCPPGASVQVDAGFLTPADNDGTTNLCVTPSSQRFTQVDGGVGDRGTPGAPNVACP